MDVSFFPLPSIRYIYHAVCTLFLPVHLSYDNNHNYSDFFIYNVRLGQDFKQMYFSQKCVGVILCSLTEFFLNFLWRGERESERERGVGGKYA